MTRKEQVKKTERTIGLIPAALAWRKKVFIQWGDKRDVETARLLNEWMKDFPGQIPTIVQIEIHKPLEAAQ